MSKLGIYVHIPFCESKCIYCDFASFVTPNEVKEKYFDYLIKEIEGSNQRGREVDTIYIGGGTPSCVDAGQIGSVINCLKDNFKVLPDAEISIECNPNSANYGKLKAYKEMGINRISFGVQSLDDETLKFIGRRHNRQGALQAIENANWAGFKNINADLLIGLPLVEGNKLCDNAKNLIDAGVTHISAYMLQVEEGTPLSKMVTENPKLLPSEDECVEEYYLLSKCLKEKGFDRYEISNFARSGYECKHNLKYWSREEYLGFGLGAHCFVGEKRISNSRNFERYFTGEKNTEILSVEDKIQETVMLGLRCKLGFSKEELLKLGYDIDKNDKLSYYLNKNILKQEKGRVYLNPDYYGVSNFIIVELLP